MAEQSNIGMNLLIAGVVLGVGAAVMGFVTTSTEVGKFNGSVDGQNPDVLNELTESVKETREAVDSKKLNFKLVDVSPEQAKGGRKVRFTPLFYSPELWQVAKDNDTKVIDIYKANPIHRFTPANGEGSPVEVPNSWFIENGLQSVLCYANALSMDSDGDGFCNYEEFAAKTKPTDAASCPSLLDTNPPKLEVVDVQRDSFIIQVDSSFTFEENPAEVSVKIFRKEGDKDPIAKFDHLKAGDSFGLPEAKDRFKVLEFPKVAFHDSMGTEVQEPTLRVHDNVTLNLEKDFNIRAGRYAKIGKKDSPANQKGRRISDSFAVLRTTAGAEKGATVRVAEMDKFTVPGTQVQCTLESIDAAGTVNIKADGALSPVSVPLAADFKQKSGKAPKAAPAPAPEGGAEAPADNPDGGASKPGKKPGKGNKGRK